MTMASDLKLLTSRRAYEFGMDQLRLSLLCTPQVQEQIGQTFTFQAGGLGTPPPTFGPVFVTMPPGLVYNVGSWQGSNGSTTPIRFIHFEQRRLVIDVAGPSSVIDPIYQALRELVKDLAIADGSPAIGKVERTLDYSEFSGRFSFDFEELLAPAARDFLRRATNPREQIDDSMVVVPALAMHRHRGDEDYEGTVAESRQLTLTLRAGTRPEDRVGFSGAPLDSEAHHQYLIQLEEALVKQRP